MAWYENQNGEPQNDSLEEIPENAFTKPFPSSLWRIDPNVNDGLPYHEILEDVLKSGAFFNVRSLTAVSIPKSVRKIGEISFSGTSLKEVTISPECEYFPTSFPENCKINFYDLTVYGQLTDGCNSQIIDFFGIRIHVKGGDGMADEIYRISRTAEEIDEILEKADEIESISSAELSEMWADNSTENS